MTRLAVGRPWKEATREQRGTLIKEFRTLLIRTYASAFTYFNVINVEYLPLQPSEKEGRATVNTRILLPGGAQPVPVDYAMQLKEGAWKVYDVRVGGAFKLELSRSAVASYTPSATSTGVILA